MKKDPSAQRIGYNINDYGVQYNTKICIIMILNLRGWEYPNASLEN